MTEARLQFVDTNVLLYAYDPNDTKHEGARMLVEDLGSERRSALSVQVLQEFFVNATRKIAEPLAVDAARDRIEALSTWPTHVPGAPDVLAAIDIGGRYRISFWDAMIVRSAAQLDCEVLWTEDLNPGRMYEGVRAETPFA